MCVCVWHDLLVFAHVAGDSSRNGSRPASAAGSNHSNATLQLLAGGSVEPAVTAQAIRRRKAAAVSYTDQGQQRRVFLASCCEEGMQVQ